VRVERPRLFRRGDRKNKKRKRCMAGDRAEMGTSGRGDPITCAGCMGKKLIYSKEKTKFAWGGERELGKKKEGRSKVRSKAMKVGGALFRGLEQGKNGGK